jgi:hypothetical protein
MREVVQIGLYIVAFGLLVYVVQSYIRTKSLSTNDALAILGIIYCGGDYYTKYSHNRRWPRYWTDDKEKDREAFSDVAWIGL